MTTADLETQTPKRPLWVRFLKTIGYEDADLYTKITAIGFYAFMGTAIIGIVSSIVVTPASTVVSAERRSEETVKNAIGNPINKIQIWAP